MGEEEQGVVGCLMNAYMDALPILSTNADALYVLKMHESTEETYDLLS
jgi:hypothetical protein